MPSRALGDGCTLSMGIGEMRAIGQDLGDGHTPGSAVIEALGHTLGWALARALDCAMGQGCRHALPERGDEGETANAKR